MLLWGGRQPTTTVAGSGVKLSQSGAVQIIILPSRKMIPLNMVDLRFFREIFLQTQHKQPVIFTGFETGRVMFEGLPPHYQVKYLWRLDSLREQMPAVTLCASEQRRDFGKRRFEPFNVLR